MKFEDYEKLGKMLKEIEELIWTHELQPPKRSPFNRHFARALNHVNEAKNHLEEMLFIEYPKQATTDIFYGKDTSTTCRVLARARS